MSAISSYQVVPSSAPVVDSSGNVTHAWRMFFADIASGSQAYSHQVPVNAFSLTIPVGCSNLILDPAGVLASGTIILPPSATDGQVVTIATSQTITSATFSPNQGQSIVNAPTTLTASGCAFIFVQSTQTWYRKQ